MGGCRAAALVDSWPLGLWWLAPGTFPFFYITLRIGGGEEPEKDADVPMTGFGEMWTHTYRGVPCFANMRLAKCNKWIFHVLLPMGTGKLCLPLLWVTCSARSVSHASLSCQQCSLAPMSLRGQQFHSPHHSLARTVVVSPSVSILESQRHQVACPGHTASEDQNRIAPRCDSKPCFPYPSPPAQCHLKYPLKGGWMGIFLLRHIWN